MRAIVIVVFFLAFFAPSQFQAGTKVATVTVAQVHGCSPASATLQPLLRLKYTTGGGGGTAAIHALDFDITGTGEILDYKLYSTTVSTWTTPTLIPTTTTLSGSDLQLDLTTSETGAGIGTKWYWLVVSINGSVTEGTVIDADYDHTDDAINYDNSTSTVSGSASPAGFRISGTHYEVGSGGTFDHYSTLGEVAIIITDNLFIFDNTITDIHFELVSSTTETGAVTFTYNNATTAININPKAGENNLVTKPSTTTTLGSGIDFITFNGAQNIHFNGSTSASGTVMADSAWSIKNTRTASTVGGVFTFINDATNNSIKFLTLEAETEGNGGIIEFKTAASGGNDGNTLSFCTLQDLSFGGSGNFPSHGVYSLGTAGNANSGNTIDNCHFVDISTSASAVSFSIELWSNSDAWTITNNHFYHKNASTLPTVTFTQGFLLIDAGGGYTITGNYIGGQAANCAGSPYTISGSHQFRGIQLQAVSGSAITIKNNTFQNIDFTTTHATAAGNAYFVAIRLSGSADITCGAVGEGNTIGSLTSTGSITCTHNNATAVGGFMAIWDGSSAATSIAYNKIGGITLPSATSVGTTNEIIHLFTNASTSSTIDNNTIGGTVANSIDVGNNVELRVVLSEKPGGATISNNTIQNIRHNGNEAVRLIFNVDGASTISSNTLKDVAVTNTVTNLPFHGIVHGGLADPVVNPIAEAVTISNNVIQDMTLTSTDDQFIGIIVNSSGATSSVATNTIGSTSANNMSFSTAKNIVGMFFQGGGTFSFTDNTIQQFNLTDASASSYFMGVYCYDGQLTATNNTIKDISSAGTGRELPFIFGSTGFVNTSNGTFAGNTIENYTKTGASGALNAFYINSSGTITVSTNTIGSTTANNMSIASNSTSSIVYLVGDGNFTVETNTIQEFDFTNTGTTVSANGIYIGGASTLTSCASNSIKNIGCAGTKSGTLLRGIYVNSSATGHVVSKNTISNFEASTATAVNPVLYGISASGSPTGANSLIEKNTVKDFTNKATGGTAKIRGIYMNGQYEFENNVVLLSNGSNTNDVELGGFFDAGAAGEPMNVYHNTVKIYGTNTGANTSYGYEDNAAGGATTLKNNIFQNLRTGGTGAHYSIIVANTGEITTDYNYLEASTIGDWGGTDYGFADWKTNSGASNSLNGTETIENVYGVASATFAGANLGDPVIFTGGSVTQDRSDDARDALPWMGAFEGADLPLPISLYDFSGEQFGEHVQLYWQSISEINNDYFEVERSCDGIRYETLIRINGNGNSNKSIDYSALDNNPHSGLCYYKLKQVDFNGNYHYYGPVVVNFQKETEQSIIYPNPFKNGSDLKVILPNKIKGDLNISIYSTSGNKIYTDSHKSENNIISINNVPFLQQGAYIVVGQHKSAILFNEKLIVK